MNKKLEIPHKTLGGKKKLKNEGSNCIQKLPCHSCMPLYETQILNMRAAAVILNQG